MNRKKTDNLTPDRTESCLRVQPVRLWFLLLAAALLLAGGIVWLFFGSYNLTVTGNAQIVANAGTYCFISSSDIDRVKPGMNAWAAGPGATIHARIGGKSSDKVGEPIECDAYVKSIHDGLFYVKGPMKAGELQNTGRTAVIKAKGITFVICTNRTQALDEEAFRAVGVEPEDYHIIVVKSSTHYRAAWRRWVKNLVTVDMPNITSFDERKIDYDRVIRPVYPLDDADEVRKAYVPDADGRAGRIVRKQGGECAAALAGRERGD